MQEEWLPVREFPRYSVSNHGYVVNNKTGRVLVRAPIPAGGFSVCFNDGPRQDRRALALIVADAFLPPPPRYDYTTPTHLDGDRGNCRADNLVWRTRGFAIRYHRERRNIREAIWVDDYILVQTGETFDTLSIPAIKYGVLEEDISRSLAKGAFVQPHGFTFTYL